jgi:Bacterial protein of unknown function (HtrL_YibB)
MKTTVVTAYYAVKSKFPAETYLNWIRIFMAADLAVVVFGDEPSLALLKAEFPENARRRYRLKPFEQFVTSEWSWETDFDLDEEQSLHSMELYKIWNEKPFFVRDVVAENPFHTEAFAWVDIGCIRDERSLWPMHGFPDGTKFDLRKVNFLAIEPFTEAESVGLERLDERFRHVVRLGGGIFAGGAAAIERLAAVHHDTIAEAKRLRVFAGKDQNLYAFEALRHPKLFNVIASKPRPGFDPWFQLLWRWASDPPIERRYFGSFFLQRLKVHRYDAPKVEFFADLCRGRRVLHVGCTDFPIFDPATNLHLKLVPVCAVLHGLDTDRDGLATLRAHGAGETYASLDEITESYDVLLVPEVIEHVANVGEFLNGLARVRASRVVVTAPCVIGHFLNGAFNYAGVPGRLGGFVQHFGDPTAYIEEVHPDHNCWYSPYTLANTLEKLTDWRVDELWLLENKTMICAVCTRT